jgi:hypothetical protein
MLHLTSLTKPEAEKLSPQYHQSSWQAKVQLYFDVVKVWLATRFKRIFFLAGL